LKLIDLFLKHPIISDFKDYFKSESQTIGDTTLSREIEIMEKLIK
jgi:hypothetical protein